jgi:hypothetical protein
MAKTPNEPPDEGDIKAAIEDEVRKAIKSLGGGTDILLAVRDYSNAELVDTLRQLGAKSDLLTYVGSRGDTMEDDEVLYALRKWNEAAEKPPPP